MKRIALAAGLATCFALTIAPAARADDTVLRHDAKAGKDVSVSGTIMEETPAGVKIKVGKDVQTIPPEDIVYIAYQVKDVTEIEFDTPFGHEQKAEGLTGADRQKEYGEAVTGYQALLKKAKGTPNAERFLQYRIAMVAVEQAKDDPTKTAAAIAAMNSFRSTNSSGWEIVPATRTAAGLLEASGDLKGARDAYDELANNPDVPSDVRLGMSLQVAKMLLHDKTDPDAKQKAAQKLQTVLAGATDAKQKAYVQVYLAQTEVAQGNVKDAKAKLDDALKAAGDDDALKALAYNALGDYYQAAKQPDDAFWQYLRVDVLYNQDREEHARALYNLWKLFDSVRGDQPRSKECLDRLKDKSLAGTEYQILAVKETESGTKTP